MDITMHGIRLQENRHRKENIEKRHYHEVFQIIYVLEDKGEITLNEQKHTFSKNCLAFIPPGTYHAVTSEGKMTVLVLEFDYTQLDAGTRKLLQQDPLNHTKFELLNVLEAGDVRQLLRRMLYEQKQGETVNIIAMKIYLAELLLILLRRKEESDAVDADSLRAERLKKYIETNYFEKMDSNTISQKLGISTRHVHTIFKNYYDTTPMKYLNEVRLEAAKLLLGETNKDIATICFEVGFDAISTFYRTFTNYTNLSPNKYRLKRKKEY